MSFTPINLCSEKLSSVDELAEGSVITVPRDFDFMNMSYLIRSLDLLEKAGLITLKDQSELTDEERYGLNRFIKENPKGITLNRLSVEEIMNDTSANDAFILPGETNGNILFEDPHRSDPDYWEQIWVKKEMVSDPAMLDAPETSLSPVGEFGWDGYAGAFLLADVDNRLSMFFAMSVGGMVPVKQIHHKLRDLMYEGCFREAD